MAVKSKPTKVNDVSLVKVGQQISSGKRRTIQKIYGKADNLLGNVNSEIVIEELFRQSALIRNVVTAPADDALAKGRAWTAGADSDQDEIDEIVAHQTKLGMMEVVREAYIQGRKTGGGVILIGTDDADSSLPLDPESIDKDGITSLTLLDRFDFNKIDFDTAPLSPTHNQPTAFHLHVNITGGARDNKPIHPSRLVVFRCETRKMPRGNESQEYYWGDGAIRSALDSIQSLEKHYASVELLVDEVKTATIFVDGLLKNGITKAERQAIMEASQQVIENRGILGLNVLDGAMRYETNQYNFAGIDDVTKQFMQRVAADAKIPMVRLFSGYEVGLGSTGEGSRVQYHERLQTDQASYITPPLRLLDYAIVRSALGRNAKPYVPVWNPLAETTAEQKTINFIKGAEGILKLLTAGIIDDNQGKALGEQLLANSGIGEV